MPSPTARPHECTDGQQYHRRASFDSKVDDQRLKGLPALHGTVGPVYADARKCAGGEAEAAEINAKRARMLREQLSIYAADGVSWSIWLYKDIGYQGMVYVDPSSPYMRLIQPFVDKKEALGLDFWG